MQETNVLRAVEVRGLGGRRYTIKLREYLNSLGMYLQVQCLNKYGLVVGSIVIPHEDLEELLPEFIAALRAFQDY